jgi:hypothetical protein
MDGIVGGEKQGDGGGVVGETRSGQRLSQILVVMLRDPDALSRAPFPFAPLQFIKNVDLLTRFPPALQPAPWLEYY